MTDTLKKELDFETRSYGFDDNCFETIVAFIDKYFISKDEASENEGMAVREALEMAEL